MNNILIIIKKISKFQIVEKIFMMHFEYGKKQKKKIFTALI